MKLRAAAVREKQWRGRFIYKHTLAYHKKTLEYFFHFTKEKAIGLSIFFFYVLWVWVPLQLQRKITLV